MEEQAEKLGGGGGGHDTRVGKAYRDAMLWFETVSIAHSALSIHPKHLPAHLTPLATTLHQQFVWARLSGCPWCAPTKVADCQATCVDCTGKASLALLVSSCTTLHGTMLLQHDYLRHGGLKGEG